MLEHPLQPFPTTFASLAPLTPIIFQGICVHKNSFISALAYCCPVLRVPHTISLFPFILSRSCTYSIALRLPGAGIAHQGHLIAARYLISKDRPILPWELHTSLTCLCRRRSTFSRPNLPRQDTILTAWFFLHTGVHYLYPDMDRASHYRFTDPACFIVILCIFVARLTYALCPYDYSSDCRVRRWK